MQEEQSIPEQAGPGKSPKEKTARGRGLPLLGNLLGVIAGLLLGVVLIVVLALESWLDIFCLLGTCVIFMQFVGATLGAFSEHTPGR